MLGVGPEMSVKPRKLVNRCATEGQAYHGFIRIKNHKLSHKLFSLAIRCGSRHQALRRGRDTVPHGKRGHYLKAKLPPGKLASYLCLPPSAFCFLLSAFCLLLSICAS